MATDRELGTRIKRARERLHWRQEDLARAVSVNVKTVRNWEQGTVPRNRVGALEQTLGISLSKSNGEPAAPWYDKDDPVERGIAETLPAPDARKFIAQLRAARMEHVPRAHEPPA